MADWFSQLCEKLLEISWYTWLVVIALIVMGIALFTSGKKAKWNSRRLAGAAMCIAIAFVFSCIRLFRMPQGGSITLCSMLPIVVFAMAFGPGQGLLVGVAYGLLQLLQDLYVLHPLQVLLDYPVAFGALALGGFMNKFPIPDRTKLAAGVLLGALGRFAAATVSGAVFFGSYAAEGRTALAYSLLYNLSYLGPDALFCMLVALLPGMQRIIPILRGEKQV